MNVLITGGSSGIGEGLATYLRLAGHKVTSWSRHEGVDVTKESQVKWATLASGLPSLDLVIHNAGIYFFEKEMYSRAEQMERTYAVNVVGAERVQASLLRYNKLLKGATVLAISSVDIETPLPWQAGYQCSKVALEMLMRTWELETPEYKYYIYRAHLTDTGIWDPSRGPAEYTLDLTVEEICQLIQC